ncbi:MAG: hypothetical protein JW882_14415 [Deltaproteobacteria bacterium]|nr:hypothetical protein [Deltaproteobacteria bacterium]
MEAFNIKDCALIGIASGVRAQNLRELRDLLRNIDTNSIYYHFWGGLLRPRFDNPEYHNDFAIWVARSLHNKTLAERLACIDPVTFKSLEDIRMELIESIEQSLDETEFPTWAKRDDQFEFMRFQIIVFNTHLQVNKPREFTQLLPQMSAGSIFYHFIDGRRRNDNSLDDFQNWLINFIPEHQDLIRAIKCVDPYFSPLTRLRNELSLIFSDYFKDNAS